MRQWGIVKMRITPMMSFGYAKKEETMLNVVELMAKMQKV